jgi:hypothetical protein
VSGTSSSVKGRDAAPRRRQSGRRSLVAMRGVGLRPWRSAGRGRSPQCGIQGLPQTGGSPLVATFRCARTPGGSRAAGFVRPAVLWQRAPPRGVGPAPLCAAGCVVTLVAGPSRGGSSVVPRPCHAVPAKASGRWGTSEPLGRPVPRACPRVGLPRYEVGRDRTARRSRPP